MQVSNAISQFLAREASLVFGLMGDANLPYLTHFQRDYPTQYVTVAHEATALMMAIGHARVSGRTAFASVTHGPGATNVLTALTEAARHGTPVVLLTGDPESTQDHIQRFDLEGLARLAGAEYRRLDAADQAVAALQEASRLARERRGPVVLNLPVTILSQNVSDPTVAPTTPPAQPATPALDLDQLDAALGIMASARRPVLLVGDGALQSEALPAIESLGMRLGAVAATSLLAKAAEFADVPLVGFTGQAATMLSSSVLSEADCVVAIGASMNGYTTDSGSLTQGSRIVQIDLDPTRIGRHTAVDVGLVGDARTVTEHLTEALASVDFEPVSSWQEQVRHRVAQWSPSAEFEDYSHADLVDPRAVAVTLDELLAPRRNIVTDVGRHRVACWRFLDARGGRFTHTASFGSIGLSLPASLGAAHAYRDGPTVAVLGDGSFMMSTTDLYVAARDALPLLIVVMNDGSYGAEYRTLRNQGLDPDTSLMSWPNLAVLAAAHGIRSHTIGSLADLRALGPALGELREPILLDVRTDPTREIL